MRRTDNSSFKDYKFELEKVQQENKLEDEVIYVKPVDTTIAGLLNRGVVPQENLTYSTDIPAMDNMSLMEFHKLKRDNGNSLAELEKFEKMRKENESKEKVEKSDNVEPKSE